MSSCSPARRCRQRTCPVCGPIRAGDEFRKFHDNIAAYGGRVVLVAVTGPGDDVLPRDAEGNVRGAFAYGWNVTASDRYARLWKAATISADRYVRRVLGHRGQMPRRVAVVWALQKRGVWHVHEALPAKTPVELAWSRHVVRFIDAARRREQAMPGRERWALLELERHFGLAARGFYGFGFIDRNPMRHRAPDAAYANEAMAAAYLARNVGSYLGENASAEAAVVGRRLRSYVSRRLTGLTGVTMTNLRRARYLWFCVATGEPLPSWDEELVERVWQVLLAGQALAARAP